MIQHYKLAYQKISSHFFDTNPFTWVYGLSRTVLALCMLVILGFSDTTVLFDEMMYQSRIEEQVLGAYNLFFLFGWEYITYTKIAAIVLLLVIASGWRPRYTGVLQWWITSSFFYSASIVEGGDQIATILTFLLIPVTVLDHRTWHWQKEDHYSPYTKFVGNLMFALVAIQMSVLYLNAATDKIYAIEEWKVGSAFYYYVNDAFFSYPDWMDPLMADLLTNSFFVSSVSWGTIFLELVLCAILFSNAKNKRLLFPFAVAFHFAIVLFLGLVSFFFAMLGGLILYLVPKDAIAPRFRVSLPKVAMFKKLASIKTDIITYLGKSVVSS